MNLLLHYQGTCYMFRNASDFEVIWYSFKESESEGDSSDVSCLE